MLTSDDLKAISDLFKQQDERFDAKLKQQEERLDKKLKQQETRLSRKIENVVKDVADLMHDEILPQFDECSGRVTRLEKHTKHPPGTPLGITATSLTNI
jgi:hypothetical protein